MIKKEAITNGKLLEGMAYVQGFMSQPMSGAVLVAHSSAHAVSESIYPTDVFYFAFQRGIMDKKMCVRRGFLHD